ncbi:MAG: AgmX/PglI C-terminal domain-containing protein [Polyangiaceae bacterium]|nr:AgmX/PglI C-terminal domain-containing protein [Polyangiaceae bacterium]
MTPASSDPLASRPAPEKSAAPGAIPKVRVQEPTVGPAYGPEIIQRVIRSSLKKANRCLERFADAPASKPAVLRFVIQGDGSVKQVEYLQNGKPIKPDERQSCLLGVFKGMTFPAPPGGSSITVTYPLNVDPVE